MIVLVLGGTGAMGKHLVKILAQMNYHVVVTTRKSHENQNNIQYIQGDAHSIEFLNEILHKYQGCDAIVDFMSYRTEEFAKKVNLFLESTKQYVFLSSARVYGDSTKLITENTPRLLDVCQDEQYLLTDEYALAKARQENLLFNSAHNNFTIIRPYITFSENRFQLGVLEKEAWLYRVINNRSIVFSEDIAQKRTTLTYGYDVAQGIASIIGEGKAYGQSFHITANESHTWEEILEVYIEIIENKLGRRPKVIMTKESHRISSSWKHQVLYDRYYNRCFSNKKIDSYVDTSLFKPTINALRECLEEFLEQPMFNEIHIKDQAQMDKIAKERMKFSEVKDVKKYVKYLYMRYLRKG